MSSVIFFILGTVLFFILLLNILSLPANWLLIFFFLLLYCLPQFMIDFHAILVMIAIALVAELLEAGIQMIITKRSGASRGGSWAGIFGSIIGAILGMPFLLGLGALVGALIGAWIGCYVVERMHGKKDEKASKIAFGALRGRLLGFSIKIALGAYIIVYGIQNTYLAIDTYSRDTPITQEEYVVLDVKNNHY